MKWVLSIGGFGDFSNLILWRGSLKAIRLCSAGCAMPSLGLPVSGASAFLENAKRSAAASTRNPAGVVAANRLS